MIMIVQQQQNKQEKIAPFLTEKDKKLSEHSGPQTQGAELSIG
jgi:hypothetical protein